MTFNPKSYTLTASQAVDKYEDRRKFEKENEHLAMPFPVKGLQDKIPPQFPTEMSMFGAASGSVIFSVNLVKGFKCQIYIYNF